MVIGFLALYYCAGEAADPLSKNDWLNVPAWVRRAFKPAIMVCYAVAASVGLLNIFTAWPSGAVYHVLVVTAGSGFLALLYALASLFFSYGDLKDSGEAGAELPRGESPPLA